MNGAHALVATLEANGVTTWFANPGTTEMHVVAALDDFPGVRGILCLFEGVATGAADGYARVTGTPAATLLHLGPGLANGWANLHNARRARSPLVNVIGDHATYHGALDAPLQSDIAAVASALEGWVERSTRTDDLANDGAKAVHAAYGPPGRVATLIVPSDVAWDEVTGVPPTWPVLTRESLNAPDETALRRALELLATKRVALFVGGAAVGAEELALASRIAAVTSCKVVMETFPAITDRGAGAFRPEHLVYLSEFAIAQLAEFDALLLVGAKEPVGFFAYPHVASRLVPADCEVVSVASPGTDVRAALAYLVDALGAPTLASEAGERVDVPSGELTSRTLAAAIGATMPEGVIVADESTTGGIHLAGATRFSPPHRWMTLTGGSIGMGLPVALGAAMASGGRVLAVQSDGAMMYTPQALWTMAREGLDVTVVALSNRSYAVLEMELRRIHPDHAGAPSQRMLELDHPAIDLRALASSLGVGSVRATTADELVEALRRSYATPGPTFIEAVLPGGIN